MLISTALQEIADALTAAGVVTVQEPNELELPGAYMVPTVVNFAYLSGDTFDITIEIYLLTTNNGAKENLDILQEMLFKVRSVYNVPEAEFISLPLGTSSEPLPACFITLQATITKD